MPKPSARPAHRAIPVVAPPRWRRVLGEINAPVERLAARCSRPYFLRLDARALWFYAVCLAAFAVLSILGFHGSSIEIFGPGFRYSDTRDPVVIGHYRATRVDEWNFHTPAILNQLFRDHPLALTGAADGPGKAALMTNVPCRHFTQLFRPQFWAFHLLPAELAFAVYWQAKALLLLTGVFTLLLLLTGGASGLSAFGSLWFYFSAYTQWAYSWPSLLPEMIGLFAWVMCLGFYLLVGRTPWRLALAALACASGMINFALCAYPPQQIPLVTIGVFLTGWWLWCRADRIFTREVVLIRLLALCGCFGLVATALVFFYVDARPVIIAAAHTVYPGQRITAGGGVTADAYAGHFLDFWKTEAHFPPVLGNPSEGTGYLWLAPLTLLGPGRRRAALPRDTRAALLCCWGAFVFIAAWMSLPIPSRIGHWFLYDHVLTNRCYHALGLANVAIVVLALSRPKLDALRSTAGESVCRFAGWWLVAFSALSAVNDSIESFFPIGVVALAAGYAALLAVCTTEHWRRALAICVLLPGIVVTGQINPLQRHLHVITKSALFRFARQHPECRHGKWIVYAEGVPRPGFLTAVGMQTVDSLKVIPQLADLSLFDPTGEDASVINQSGYLKAKLPVPGDPTIFDSPSPGVVVWCVDPLDPRLKQIGVRYAAFEVPPGAAITGKLKLLSPEPIAGMWLYELP